MPFAPQASSSHLVRGRVRGRVRVRVRLTLTLTLTQASSSHHGSVVRLIAKRSQPSGTLVKVVP